MRIDQSRSKWGFDLGPMSTPTTIESRQGEAIYTYVFIGLYSLRRVVVIVFNKRQVFPRSRWINEGCRPQVNGQASNLYDLSNKTIVFCEHANKKTSFCERRFQPDLSDSFVIILMTPTAWPRRQLQSICTTEHHLTSSQTREIHD